VTGKAVDIVQISRRIDRVAALKPVWLADPIESRCTGIHAIPCGIDVEQGRRSGGAILARIFETVAVSMP
jgi:hypothetical protein